MLFLCSCGFNNQVSVNKIIDQCPNGMASPYCVAIVVQNNNQDPMGFSLKNITLGQIEKSNIYTPNNDSSLDPNSCLNSTIKKKSSCTFYLKLVGESNLVDVLSTFNLFINYTVDNSLWGGSKNYSNMINIKEQTNLYNISESGLLSYYNQGKMIALVQLKSESIYNSVILDQNNYGLIYVAGESGIYQINPIDTSFYLNTGSNFGANNLFIKNNYLYLTSLISGIESGFWSMNINNYHYTYLNSIYNNVNSNINAITSTNTLYFAIGSQVIACTNYNIESNVSCTNQGNALANQVIALGNLSGTIIAASANGIFYESGIDQNAIWINLLSNPITNMISNNTLSYALDNLGGIWKINGINSVSQVGNSPILANQVTALALDNQVAGLFFAVKNGTIYYCSLSNNSCITNVLVSESVNSASMGLMIGSLLY